nr:MAG TPA: hypothetical protein [Caudoviricetes sp.]
MQRYWLNRTKANITIFLTIYYSTFMLISLPQ